MHSYHKMKTILMQIPDHMDVAYVVAYNNESKTRFPSRLTPVCDVAISNVEAKNIIRGIFVDEDEDVHYSELSLLNDSESKERHLGNSVWFLEVSNLQS
jgi:hypothetical protein